jgi:hypothetical protein
MDKKDLVLKVLDLEVNIEFKIKYNNQYYFLQIIEDDGSFYILDLETYDSENDYAETFFENDFDNIELIKSELIKYILLDDIIEINIKK